MTDQDAARWPAGERERQVAHQLAEELAAKERALVTLGRLDLSGALEQLLFAGIRGGVPDANWSFNWGDRAGALLRAAGRIGSTIPRLIRRPATARGASPIVVIATAPIHLRHFAPVAAEIAGRGGPPVIAVAAGAFDARAGKPGVAVPLASFLDPAWIARLASHGVRLVTALPTATAEWDALRPWPAGDGIPPAALRRFVASGLPRSALIGAQLDSLVRAVHPALLVAYSEVDVWGRLVPEVAHQHGIRALDLPHAEAADPWASVGIGYDAVAVYGPRAAEAIRLAGVPEERIVQVGSVRYDGLAQRSLRPKGQRGGEPRRVIFASQPARAVGSRLTPRVKADALRAAYTAAGAVAPAELVIRPHPVERDSVIDDTLPTLPRDDRVAVTVDRSADLHELLSDAWLLVTAWSQSVYEAAIAGVPSIAVNTTGGPDPAPFSREGAALGATDKDSAAMAARTLLDPTARSVALEQARAALADHFGTVDGRAAERTADLVLRLLGRGD